MESPIEEFKNVLAKVTDELERIELLQNYIWFNSDLYPDECRMLLQELRVLSTKNNYERGEAYADALQAYYGMHNLSNESFNAAALFEKAMDTFVRLGDLPGQSRMLNMLAYMNWWAGKYDLALEQAFKALKFAEQDPDKKDGLYWTKYALGVFHSDLKDYASSEKYFLDALAVDKEAQKPSVYFQARCNSGLGSVYIAMEKPDKALEHIRISRQGYQALRHEMGESRALNDLGVIERTKGNLEGAEKHLLEAFEIRNAAKFKQGMATTLIELGLLYVSMQRYQQANDFLARGLAIAEELDSKPKIYAAHQHLASLFKLTNKPWLALEHLEKFYEIKSAVVGEQVSNRLKNTQTQFATEKSEKEAEIHRLRNVELKKAYEEIEMKNKDILDSINYARRIQQAILPTDEQISKAFPSCFILYQPKDVVSGDFFWSSTKGDKHFIAAVDCTGHGVPGAFMSMIGSALLNEIVNEKNISAPAAILEALREGVIKALKQTGAEGENKDGMDISICVLEGNKLSFAAANNPLWVISNGLLKETKGDKQPIGIYSGMPKPFTDHTLQMNKGDSVFLFTDGYADQFGGPRGKKFKYKKLQELLVSISDRSMEEQKNILHSTIESWRGELEQVDDILIVGIRI